jgi:hypothetical protein
MLFHFLVPHSINERVGGFHLNESGGKSSKSTARQLFDDCSEIL